MINSGIMRSRRSSLQKPYRVLALVLVISSFGSGQSIPEDAPAKVLTAPNFKMSPEAKAAGIDGQLIVELAIDKTGTVKKADVIYGPSSPCNTNPKREMAEVRKQVEDIFMKSRFSPAIKDSKPHDSEKMVLYLIGSALERARSRREAEEAMRAGKPRPPKIDVGVVNGIALDLPKPPYPMAARVSGAAGFVRVQVVIDENGNVVRAEPQQGHFAFYDVAREAACKARFSRTFLGNQPIAVTGIITYNFVR